MINCSYNSHKSLTGNHLDTVSKTLDLYSSTYDKIILLRYFNTKIDEQHMQSFCDNYPIKSLIRKPTCYKDFEKSPTCINLILNSMPHSFQGTSVIETELSDFHLVTFVVMRKKSEKLNLGL